MHAGLERDVRRLHDRGAALVDRQIAAERKRRLLVLVEELDPPLEKLRLPTIVIVKKSDVWRASDLDQSRVVRREPQVDAGRLVLDSGIVAILRKQVADLLRARAVLR